MLHNTEKHYEKVCIAELFANANQKSVETFKICDVFACKKSLEGFNYISR